MIVSLLGIVVVIVAAVVLVLVIHVDDWSRDLTQNYAETSPDAADPLQRPIESTQSPDELAALVEQTAGELPRWQVAARDTADGQIVLRLVRTTPLMRYKDDITVRIEPTAAGSLLRASSKSRVGKGDLGQNPRNLRELLTPVRNRLASPTQAQP